MARPSSTCRRDGPADYRIFVRSKRLTAREAAAMLVGVRGEPIKARRLHALTGLPFINPVRMGHGKATVPQALRNVAAASW